MTDTITILTAARKIIAWATNAILGDRA